MNSGVWVNSGAASQPRTLGLKHFICYEMRVCVCVCVCMCLKMKRSDLGAQILLLLLLLIVIFWGTDNGFPPLWKWGTDIVDTLAWFLWLTWALTICQSRIMMKVSFASCSPILESLLPHSGGDVPGVEPKWPGPVWGWYFLMHELLCKWDTTASVTDEGEVELRLGKEILHFPLILFFKN